ncbi:MAG: hypothetical protein QW632_03030 [Ignisphaera sp.]
MGIGLLGAYLLHLCGLISPKMLHMMVLPRIMACLQEEHLRLMLSTNLYLG